MNSSHNTYQFHWKQWLAAFAASSVMFGDEMDVVWFSLTKHMLSELELMTEASLVIIGAIMGAVTADIYGRRGALLLSSIFVIPRMVAPYLTAELTIWIKTLILSFGSGVNCVVVPLYISEIASTNNRSNLMLLQLSVYSLGRLAWAAIAVFPPYGDFETVKFARSSIFAISISLHAIILWVFPETPQYLNWKKRYQETAKSLPFFEVVENVRLTQDPTNPPTNSDPCSIRDEKWSDGIREIVRLDNRRSLAMIFSLVAIRQASGQEWNSFAVYMMTIYLQRTGTISFSLIGFFAVTSIFCVFIMLTIGIFGRKLSLLLVIFAGLISTIIGTTTLAEHHWIFFGIHFTRYLGHLIFIGVTLAYVGTLFPINVRAIAIAAVISCEVLTRNSFFLIERLIDGTAVSRQGYIPPQSYSNYGTFLAAFFFVLIFFPKTNKLPSNEIAIGTSTDAKSLL